MPSYTFVSTANAFVLRGAKIVFVDIRRDTMNIDESLIEAAITDKTRAIVPVHYAGVACEMDTIMALAAKYNLYVVEDAAQGVMSTYKGRALGTIGHIGCFSFHETKTTPPVVKAVQRLSTIVNWWNARKSFAKRALTVASSSAVWWISTPARYRFQLFDVRSTGRLSLGAAGSR